MQASSFWMSVRGAMEVCFMTDIQQNKDRETEKTIASSWKDC